ncbi:hypothetical protein [Candidatus Poriferisodalis sp.]|uniref:hypothetical protein n=1 Tax=Candidatus Poriferisodalis sp. TaxID=3101277 RepID=UPI003AF85424
MDRPDGLLFNAPISGDSGSLELNAHLRWGSALQFELEPEDPSAWPPWPDGAWERTLPYGDYVFELADYGSGFVLEYGGIRREYHIGPWSHERVSASNIQPGDAPGHRHEPPDAPLSGTADYYGIFFFAGTDGERIAIESVHNEPTCGAAREVYLISLRDGTVQTCIGTNGAVRLAASPGSYTPLDDLRLPPSGWLYEQPCISYSHERLPAVAAHITPQNAGRR